MSPTENIDTYRGQSALERFIDNERFLDMVQFSASCPHDYKEWEGNPCIMRCPRCGDWHFKGT